MTNLGGHDMESVLEAFEGVTHDRPTCFLAYTIKGYGLPFAGHKDNHSGLMSPDEMEAMRASHGVAPGEEWEPFAGLDVPEPDIRRFLAGVPFNQWVSRRPRARRSFRCRMRRRSRRGAPRRPRPRRPSVARSTPSPAPADRSRTGSSPPLRT